MKNESETENLSRIIKMLFQGLSVSQRMRLLGILFSWVVEYRFKRLQKTVSRRARIHWIGGVRPRRRERLLFVFIVFAPMLILELNHQLLWAVSWGGAASVFVIVHSFRKLICVASN